MGDTWLLGPCWVLILTTLASPYSTVKEPAALHINKDKKASLNVLLCYVTYTRVVLLFACLSYFFVVCLFVLFCFFWGGGCCWCRPGLVKGQWSREEDELLTAVFNEGHKNWGALAARIPGRTSKQCRERWCHHLDPRIVKGKWTAEEDQTIVSMHQEMGNKWATIAQVGVGCA